MKKLVLFSLLFFSSFYSFSAVPSTLDNIRLQMYGAIDGSYFDDGQLQNYTPNFDKFTVSFSTYGSGSQSFFNGINTQSKSNITLKSGLYSGEYRIRIFFIESTYQNSQLNGKKYSNISSTGPYILNLLGDPTHYVMGSYEYSSHNGGNSPTSISLKLSTNANLHGKTGYFLLLLYNPDNINGPTYFCSLSRLYHFNKPSSINCSISATVSSNQTEDVNYKSFVSKIDDTHYIIFLSHASSRTHKIIYTLSQTQASSSYSSNYKVTATTSSSGNNGGGAAPSEYIYPCGTNSTFEVNLSSTNESNLYSDNSAHFQTSFVFQDGYGNSKTIYFLVAKYGYSYNGNFDFSGGTSNNTIYYKCPNKSGNFNYTGSNTIHYYIIDNFKNVSSYVDNFYKSQFFSISYDHNVWTIGSSNYTNGVITTTGKVSSVKLYYNLKFGSTKINDIILNLTLPTNISVSDYSSLSAGGIQDVSNIQSRNTNFTINSSSVASGGSGSYTYKWQKSSNGTSWSDISSSNSTFWTAQASNSTYYRRVVSDATCTNISSVNSNAVKVKIAISPSVNQFYILGVSNPVNLCHGNTYTLSATYGGDPVGGNGSYTYKWQNRDSFDENKNCVEGPEPDITADANSTSWVCRIEDSDGVYYDLPSRNFNTYSTMTIPTINDVYISYNTSTNLTCSPSGGDGTYAYSWYKDNSKLNKTTQTYNTGNLTSNTVYSVKAYDGKCVLSSNPIQSNDIHVIVYNDADISFNNYIEYNKNSTFTITCKGGSGLYNLRIYEMKGSDWDDGKLNDNAIFQKNNIDGTLYSHEIINITHKRYFGIEISDPSDPRNVYRVVKTVSCYNPLSVSAYSSSESSGQNYNSFFTLTCGDVSGGSGSYGYIWYSGNSIDNAKYNAENCVSNNKIGTGKNLTITVPSSDTYYACRVYDTKFYSTSTNAGTYLISTFNGNNAYLVKVNPEIKTQPANSTNCSNVKVTLSTVAQYGGNGTYYTYQWMYSDSQNGTFFNCDNGTSSSFIIGNNDNVGITKYYKCEVSASNGLNVYTNTVCVTKYNNFDPKTISVPNSLSYNVNGNTLKISGEKPVGGNSVYSYQWEKSSSSNSGYSNISNQTDQNLSLSSIKNSAYYRRASKSGCENGYSYSLNSSNTNNDYVLGRVLIKSGKISGASTSIEYGKSINLSIEKAEGGFGKKYKYSWYEMKSTSAADDNKKTDGVSLIDETGSSADATPPIFNVTFNNSTERYFACRISDVDDVDNVCWSDVVTCKCYDPLSVSAYSSSESSGQNYNSSFTLTCGSVSGGSGSYGYIWYSGNSIDNAKYNADNCVSNNKIGTGNNLTITVPSSDTYYACRVYDTKFYNTSTNAGTYLISTFNGNNAYLIKVNPEIKTQPVNSIICSNESVTLSIEAQYGGNGTYTYQWMYSDSQNGTFSNCDNGTSSSFIIGNNDNVGITKYYKCKVSASNGLNVYSNTIYVTKYNNFNAGKIQSDIFVDGSSSFNLNNIVSPSGGDGNYSYKWYCGTSFDNINTLIENQNSANLTISNGISNNLYYKRIVSDSKCNTSGSASLSNDSNNKYSLVTVNLKGSIDNSSESESICYNDNITLTANISGGNGNYNYNWYLGSVSDNNRRNNTISNHPEQLLTENLLTDQNYVCVITDQGNANNVLTLYTTVNVFDEFSSGFLVSFNVVNSNESFIVKSVNNASGGNEDIHYRWYEGSNKNDISNEIFLGNLLVNSFDIQKCFPARPETEYVYSTYPQYIEENVLDWGDDVYAMRIKGKSSLSGSGRKIFIAGGNSNSLLSTLSSNKTILNRTYIGSAYIKNNSTSQLIFKCANSSDIIINPSDYGRYFVSFVGDGVSNLDMSLSVVSDGDDFDFDIWHPMIEISDSDEPSVWCPCSDDNILNDFSSINIEKEKADFVFDNGTYVLTASNISSVADESKIILKNITDLGSYDLYVGNPLTFSVDFIESSSDNLGWRVNLLGFDDNNVLVGTQEIFNKEEFVKTYIPNGWNNCSYFGLELVLNKQNQGQVNNGDKIIFSGLRVVPDRYRSFAANGPDLVIPNGIDNTLYFKRIAYDSKCNLDGVSSNVCSVKVNITADVNNPTENNPICNGTGQTEISVIAHGGCGQYFYQWSELLNNGQWHELSGQDKSNLVLSGLTSNMTYKCVITDAVESDIQYTTPDIVVNVYEPLTIGVTNNTIYPIDYGSSVDIGGVAATGASGVYYYDWEISNNGQDFEPYLTNQGSQINVSPLINTTYRRIDKDSLCGQLTNVNIDVRVGLYPGTIVGDTTVCYNGTALVLGDSLPGGGSGKYEYHWQKLIPGSSSWENITESGVDAGYGWKYESMGHIPGMYRDVKYRRMVVDQSNTALSAYSNEITVHVYDEFTVSFPEDEIICFGSSTSEKNVVATGGFGDYRYQWTSNYDPLFGQILSETSSLLDNNLNHSSDLQEGVTRYTIKVTDACGSTDGQGEGSIESSYKVTMLKPVKISPIAFDINGRNETSLYVNDGESGTVRMFTNSALGGSSEYTYLWSYRDGHSNWKDFNNSNKTDHVISYSDFVDTAYFRLSVTDSKCSESVVSDSLSFFIIPFNKPVLNGGQDICYSTVPSTIRLITRPGDGVYSYSWYKKGVSDNEYVKMEGQVSDSLALANVSKNWLTENTYYKVRVSNGSREVDSDPILVTVLDQVDAGKIGIGVLGLEIDTVYTDMMSPEIMNIMNAEGGRINPSNVSYQWYQKVGDKGAFTAIEGATGASYQPEEITKSVSYYRAVIDECKTVYSNTVTIIYSTKVPTNFVALSKPVLNNGYGQNICYNSVPSAFRMTTLAGDGEYSYSWYRKMESESSYQLIEGQVGDTLVLDDNSRNRLTESAYYKVRVSAGSRAVDSDPILVTVLDQVSGGKISVGFTGLDVDTVYAGMLPPILKNSISAEGGLINESNVSYQWYQKEDGQGNFTAILGANTANYQPDSINKSVSYYREVIDDCGSAVSNTVTLVYSTKKPVNVITLQQPVINGGVGMNICYNSVPDAFRLTTRAGEGSYSYAWFSKKASDKDYSLIEGYSADTLVLSDISSNRLIESAYYKVRVSAGSRSVESDPILVTVLEQVNAGSIGIGNNSLTIDSVYYGQQPSLIKNVSLAEGGLISSNNSSYQWYEKNDGEYEFKLIEGAVSKDYQPGNLKKTTSYYRMVVDQCAESASNTVKVVVKAAEVVVNPGGGGVVVNPGGEEEDPYEGMEEIYDDDDNVVMTRVKSSYCLGDKVELKLNSDVNGKFKWFDLDGYHIKDGRNFTIANLKNDSVLICKVYDNDGVVIAKQRIDVKVINVSVDFIASKTILEAGESVHFVNSTSGYSSYEWNFGDGSDFSYDAEPWHYYHKTGTFDVTLTVETKEGCRSSYTKNDFVSVSGYSDIDDVETSSDFVVYPNPSDGVVNVVAAKPVTVDVFSSDNRVVARYLDSESHFVDLSSFAEGVYMFHIVGDGIDEMIRVVKY